MAINFPSSPALNDIYTYDTRSWKFNGVAWDAISVTYGPTGPTGPIGPTGPEGGPTGPTGPAGPIVTGTVSSSYPSGGNDGDIWLVVY